MSISNLIGGAAGCLFLWLAHLPAGQEPAKVIYDEKDVPAYALP